MMEEKAKIAFDVRNRIRTQEMCMMAHQERRKSLNSEKPNKILEKLIKPKMDGYITATKTNHTVNKKLEL